MSYSGGRRLGRGLSIWDSWENGRYPIKPVSLAPSSLGTLKLGSEL